MPARQRGIVRALVKGAMPAAGRWEILTAESSAAAQLEAQRRSTLKVPFHRFSGYVLMGASWRPTGFSFGFDVGDVVRAEDEPARSGSGHHIDPKFQLVWQDVTLQPSGQRHVEGRSVLRLKSRQVVSAFEGQVFPVHATSADDLRLMATISTTFNSADLGWPRTSPSGRGRVAHLVLVAMLHRSGSPQTGLSSGVLAP